MYGEVQTHLKVTAECILGTTFNLGLCFAADTALVEMQADARAWNALARKAFEGRNYRGIRVFRRVNVFEIVPATPLQIQALCPVQSCAQVWSAHRVGCNAHKRGCSTSVCLSCVPLMQMPWTCIWRHSSIQRRQPVPPANQQLLQLQPTSRSSSSSSRRSQVHPPLPQRTLLNLPCCAAMLQQSY